MIKKLFKKINNKIKEKTGASMAIVVTTMSMLIIMGTAFSTIAYNSYQLSYGNICRQQAMYTAKSVMDGFVDEFKTNGDLRSYVGDALTKKVNELDSTKDITEIQAEMAVSGLHSSMESGSASDECKMYVSYSDNTRSKLRLTVKAKYKGFENSLSVILGYTNKASIELSKIMSNTLFFTSPIVDMMYYVDSTLTNPFTDFAIEGDVYVDRPMPKPIDKDKNPTGNPYIDLSVYPNKDTTGWEKPIAVGGHTLEINNEGRGNVLYDSVTKLPVPALDSHGNKILIRDPETNEFIPMKKIDGTTLTETIKKPIFYLNDNADDYIYVDDKNNIVDKTYALNNKIFEQVVHNINGVDTKVLVPKAIPILKDGKFDGYQIDKSATPNYNYILRGYDNYLNRANPGVQYNETADELDVKYHGLKTDKAGYPILSTLLENQNGMDASVVDCNKTNNGYNIYKITKHHPMNHTELFGGPKKVDLGAYKWGNKDDNWSFVELYETRDPITGDKIIVTGRVSAHYNRGFHFNRCSFKRVHITDEDKYSKSAVTYYPLVTLVNEKGEVQEWTEWKDATVGNYQNYNLYDYQLNRKTGNYSEEKILYEYEPQYCPNDWTEVFLRSHYYGNIELTYPMPVVIKGTLKCNTDVLLGLYNRSVDGLDGHAHGFKKPGTSEIVPVAFDSNKHDYNLPQHNVLSVNGDVFANGDVRGENLWVTGSLYAKDNNPDDDNIEDALGWKHNCKGNVYLEQQLYTTILDFGAYMDIAGDVVADGYVFIGGVPADKAWDKLAKSKAKVGGNIYAGKYNSDGSRWGNKGIGKDIPRRRYYRKDGSKDLESFDIIANGNKDYIPGGIYGYRSINDEKTFGNENYYRLGQGDVVLERTEVTGSIFATGDVYLTNGTIVHGSIYTPGNVYITKGESTVKANIEDQTDGRCRVFGNIYAGGTVAVTGGCEIGDYNQKDTKGEGYFSSIYCNDFYASGRIALRDHDVLSGNLYCKNNAVIKGLPGVKYSRVGYNGGNIYVGNDLITDQYVALGKEDGNIFVGGDLELNDHCALDNKGIAYIKGDLIADDAYIHSSHLLVGGDLEFKNHTYYYLNEHACYLYVVGNITHNDGAAVTNDPAATESYGFKFYCKNDHYSAITVNKIKDIVYNARIIDTNHETLTSETKIIGTDYNILVDDKLNPNIYPQDWRDMLKKDDYSYKLGEVLLDDLTYVQELYYRERDKAMDPLNETLLKYQNSVNAKIREWTPPAETEAVYTFKNQGINGDNYKIDTIVKDDKGNETKKSVTTFKTSDKHYTISDSVYDMPEITLADNEELILDTSKRNIHLLVKGNITLGVNASIKIKGTNMAFIYMKNDNVQNEIYLGKQSKFGQLINDPADTNNKRSAGLHVVATEQDFRFVVNEGTEVNSYNYMPRGILKFNLERPDKTKEDPIIANPQGSYVINRLEGLDLDAMNYWRIKFKNTKSPLILDIHGDLNYGNSDTEITDFKGVEWEVIEYN